MYVHSPELTQVSARMFALLIKWSCLYRFCVSRRRRRRRSSCEKMLTRVGMQKSVAPLGDAEKLRNSKKKNLGLSTYGEI